MLEEVSIECPYCGACFDTAVDCSAGSQAYVEDCAVCCQPIDFTVQVGIDGVLCGVNTRRQDE